MAIFFFGFGKRLNYNLMQNATQKKQQMNHHLGNSFAVYRNENN